MLCEVLKPIVAGGKQLQPGDRVDTAGWRWTKQLIEQRKIRPILAHEDSLPEVEAQVALGKKRGRPTKKEQN